LDCYTDEGVVVGIDDGLHILSAVTKSIAAAMDPDKYWKVGRILRSIDVEEQTVLSGESAFTSWSDRALRALGCVCIGLDDLTAVLCRNLRRLETQRSNWRCSESNA
jgi:hypothetical protein